MAKTEKVMTSEEVMMADAVALEVEPASVWADRDPPPARDWICEPLGIAAGRVSTLGGNGGLGKTNTAIQIAIAVVINKPLWNMPINGGPVLTMLCEDEQTDVERRTRIACAAEGIDLSNLDNLFMLSRDGHDNVLCAFERDQIQLTAFYWQLDATLARIKPRLTFIDSAADVFAGDFMSTPHVRQFIKTALGGLCLRHGTAICLLAHPSASAMASGDGGGFSVAWNNSVRSRLYLRRPKSDDAELIADRRVLEVKKSNYGPTGATVPLVYHQGRFILDNDPIEEGSKPARTVASKVNTRSAMAVIAYFKERAPAGQVIRFSDIYAAMLAQGQLAVGKEEAQRKALSRLLKSLEQDGLLRACESPRGSYRLISDQETSRAY